MGNVPLAAVLWSGGISFAGVLAFLFADLIVLPIVAVYRKYYGTAFALRITTLMLITMVLAGLIVDGLFSVSGLLPTGPRPSRATVFGSIQVDYKLFLNLVAVAIFAALFWLTARRGVTDPVCGMKVDRAGGAGEERGSPSCPVSAAGPGRLWSIDADGFTVTVAVGDQRATFHVQTPSAS